MAISIFNAAVSVVVAFIIQRIGSLVYRYIKTCAAARKVPGLPGATLIKGNLQWETVDEYLQTATKYVQKTGVKLNTIWIYFFYPVYSVSHPDYAKIILKSNAPKDDDVGAAYTMLRPWIGNGLLAHQGGKEWERNRHLLTPAFHFDILKDYCNVFNDVADELLIQLSRTANGRSVEISNPITVATLDSLLRCALSYHGNVQEAGHDHPYVDAVQKLASYFNDRIVNPFLYPDFIFYRTRTGRHFRELCNYVHNFAENIIMNRRQSLQQSDINLNQSEDKKVEYRKRKLDFLDILLTAKDDQGKGLTDLQIRSEVDTFMFAGHDTASSAISWAIHALAKYPNEQANVFEEVSRVAGDQPIEWEHLQNLRYQSLFIKEVMRMYSIVPIIGRLTDEPMSFDDIIVPANSIIELNIHAMNHRQDVWPDHEEFRPERFEEPSGKGRDPFSFIPFSAGSRNCIGQNFATNEIKVIVSRLVQTYRIELDMKHTAVPIPQLVMRPKNGIRVILHPR